MKPYFILSLKLMLVNGLKNSRAIFEKGMVYHEHCLLLQNCSASLDALTYAIVSIQAQYQSEGVSIEHLRKHQKTLYYLIEMQQHYRSVFDRLIVEHAVIRFHTPNYILCLHKSIEWLEMINRFAERLGALKHQTYHLDKIEFNRQDISNILRVGC